MRVTEATKQFDQLSPKILDYIHKGKNNENLMIDLQSKMSQMAQKVGDLNQKVALHTKALSVLNTLIQTLSTQHINRVQALVTQALQTIFHDRDYRFEIAVSDRGNNSKQAEMFLIEVKDGQVIKSPLRDGVGGGIQSVVGFVLQIFYIEHLGASKVLFLDESLSQVSVQYIEGVAQFIKVLCEQKDFRVVLISHDQRLIPYADKTIRVEKGVVHDSTDSR